MVWIQLTLHFNNHFQPVIGENVKKRNQNKLTYSLYSKVVIGLKWLNETNTVISIGNYLPPQEVNGSRCYLQTTAAQTNAPVQQDVQLNK